MKNFSDYLEIITEGRMQIQMSIKEILNELEKYKEDQRLSFVISQRSKEDSLKKILEYGAQNKKRLGFLLSNTVMQLKELLNQKKNGGYWGIKMNGSNAVEWVKSEDDEVKSRSYTDPKSYGGSGTAFGNQ